MMSVVGILFICFMVLLITAIRLKKAKMVMKRDITEEETLDSDTECSRHIRQENIEVKAKTKGGKEMNVSYLLSYVR